MISEQQIQKGANLTHLKILHQCCSARTYQQIKTTDKQKHLSTFKTLLQPTMWIFIIFPIANVTADTFACSSLRKLQLSLQFSQKPTPTTLLKTVYTIITLVDHMIDSKWLRWISTGASLPHTYTHQFPRLYRTSYDIMALLVWCQLWWTAGHHSSEQTEKGSSPQNGWQSSTSAVH